jgi:ADP-heptose:LPS heptosyltransferase
VPPDTADAAWSLLYEAGYSPGADLIAVHPGSGGTSKCWPLKRYFELIDHLQSINDAFVILFTGDGEENELRKAVGCYARVRRNVLHAADLELISAASMLSHCRLYIGNDSGFSHLAGMLGCNTIALFGPTDPLRWKPMGPHVEVVSTGALGPMTRIRVEDVIAKTRSAKSKNGQTVPVQFR